VSWTVVPKPSLPFDCSANLMESWSRRLHCQLGCMVQATQDGAGHPRQMCRKPMPMYLSRHQPRGGGLRYPWPQGHRRTADVGLVHPGMQEAASVVLGEWDQNVPALPPERAQRSLAESRRLGTSHEGVEGSHPQVAYTPVERLGEDGIAVVPQATVRVLRGDRLAPWLERPLSRGRRGRVGMQHPTRRMGHDHKDGEQLNGRRHHQAAIAGDERLRMIAAHRSPALG
jgi:hypothetical protein